MQLLYVVLIQMLVASSDAQSVQGTVSASSGYEASSDYELNTPSSPSVRSTSSGRSC